MKTDLGRAFVEDFDRTALRQIMHACDKRAAYLRQTPSNKASHMRDAHRFEGLARAVDLFLEEESET